MFKINNLTDHEKLLVANSYVKLLKSDIKKLNQEKGELQSEIEELKFRLKQEKPENNKLHAYKVQIKNTRAKSRKYQRLYESANSELIMLKNDIKNKGSLD